MEAAMKKNTVCCFTAGILLLSFFLLAAGSPSMAAARSAGGISSVPSCGSSSAKAKPQYSDRTLLLSVDDQFTESSLKTICKKYHLTVVYKYNSFSMYALQTKKALKDQEMENLISRLEKEKHVLGAERDRIEYLDSSSADPDCISAS
jgi:hypothetical protein